MPRSDEADRKAVTAAAPPSELHPEQPRSRRSMLVAAFGTVVEWYDFTLYLYLAPVLTRVFFGGDENSLLWTFGVFAAAYGMRPIGAMVFGHVGDRLGRKSSLVVSAVLMAVAMLLTALVPGRESIGWLAPVLLFLLRCLMGFSVGGEYTGILVFLLESAPRKSRGYVASWAAANSEIGTLLAVGVSAVLSAQLSQSQLDAWGWRVTFVIGALLAITMLFLRSTLEETASFERMQQKQEVSKNPLLDVLRQQPRAVWLAFVISALGSIAYYLNITYVPTFLTEQASSPVTSSLVIGTVAAIAVLVVTPPVGALSDRIGRRRTLIGVSLIFAVSTPLLFWLMLVHSSAIVFTAVVLVAIPAAAASSINTSSIPEQFAAQGRFSGMAIGYNLATAIFGGLTPLIATFLIDVTGWKLLPGFYAAAVGLVVIPLVWNMRETAGTPLLDTVAELRDVEANRLPYPDEPGQGGRAHDGVQASPVS